MKKRFSEEQIIGILKEQEAGFPVKDIYCGADLLPLEVEVWRDGGIGRQAAS